MKNSMRIAGGASLVGWVGSKDFGCSDKPLFKISLAEWSLHRSLMSGQIDLLDFSSIAKKEFVIDAVEYVNTFFFHKSQDKHFLTEMKTWAKGEGVRSLLIMCDSEGLRQALFRSDIEEAKLRQIKPYWNRFL